jgi:hypothetical protein
MYLEGELGVSAGSVLDILEEVAMNYRGGEGATY